MPVEPLQNLLAIAEIRRLKARYCRLVDTKQWDRLKQVFAPDATVAGFASVPDGTTAEAFVAGIARTLAPAVSLHHVHEPEIVVTGPDAARAVWPMMDYVDFGDTATGPAGRGWIGWGFYEEAYARIDGAWRIAFMRLARQRMNPLAADHPPAAPGRVAPDPDWL